MRATHTRGETHGCIVCGRPYELYVAYDSEGRLIGSKVMSGGGKSVPHATRPLVACEHHLDDQIQRAVERVYGRSPEDEDEL
jgi:hypothetical protein